MTSVSNTLHQHIFRSMNLMSVMLIKGLLGNHVTAYQLKQGDREFLKRLLVIMSYHGSHTQPLAGAESKPQPQLVT